jgi:hypothetical protein
MVFSTRNGSSGDTAKINGRYWAENAFKPPGEFVACAAALRKINRTQVQPNVCYTAFAGVALKCPVAMRCSRLLLSRTQGGGTNIRPAPA